MSPENSTSESALLLERLRSGELPREVVLLAARGFLPLSQEELVGVLVHLSATDDEEVVTTAKASLADLPPRALISFARDPQSPAMELRQLVDLVDNETVLEAVLRNRSTDDATIRQMATRVTPHLQDVIVINQERLIRSPEILEALLENPHVSPDVRRRVGEMREEFFEKPRRAEADRPSAGEAAELADEVLTPEQQAELDALLGEAAEAGETVSPDTPPPVDLDEEGESLWAKIQRMTVAQKVQRAYKGSMTERSILVRERNKMVAGAVVRNPRITETEIEAIAGLRQVEEEVLRVVGMNRSWMAKYPIMLALIRNPKAPIGVVLPLINRLNVKDLKSLTRDRGVPETVRSVARRLYTQRKP